MPGRPDTAAPVRDAATVIVLRRRRGGYEALVGERGARAAFLPSKTVFPGGAVDPADMGIDTGLALPCRARLETAGGPAADVLAAAAIRELREETGLMLGRPARWPRAPAPWRAFAAAGLRPDAAGLRYVFRALTPPGRPRRFDARFFTLDADAATEGGAPDGAEPELSNLRWEPLAALRRCDLPFVTEVVLAEIAAMRDPFAPPPFVPFFDGETGRIGPA